MKARTIEELVGLLSKPLPRGVLKQRKQGGNTLDYIPWHIAVRILDIACTNWSWQVGDIWLNDTRLFLYGTLTVETSDGTQTVRGATGTELLACSSYGDPSSNAESMAKRRACAHFGLGLYLYDKDQTKFNPAQWLLSPPEEEDSEDLYVAVDPPVKATFTPAKQPFMPLELPLSPKQPVVTRKGPMLDIKVTAPPPAPPEASKRFTRARAEIESDDVPMKFSDDDLPF
jgi:hypothetical protein